RDVTSDDHIRAAATGGSATTRAEPGTVVAARAQPSAPSLDDLAAIDVGSVVRGRFELESMIGEGGMGVVYRAIDRLHKDMQDLDPYVAIKILNSNLKRHPS